MQVLSKSRPIDSDCDVLMRRLLSLARRRMRLTPLAGTRSRPVREFERRLNSEPDASAFRLISPHLIFRRARDKRRLRVF